MLRGNLGLRLSWKLQKKDCGPAVAGDSCGTSESIQGVAAALASGLIGSENVITSRELEDNSQENRAKKTVFKLPGEASMAGQSMSPDNSLQRAILLAQLHGCNSVKPGTDLKVRSLDKALLGGVPSKGLEPVDAGVLLAGRPEVSAVHARLGAGSFGEVFRCTMKESQREVAVKVLHKGSSISQKREVELSGRLRHPNLVQAYSAIKGPPDMIVMELCSGGSLGDLLHESPKQADDLAKLGLRTRARAMADIVAAVEYLHANHVVHRDIKSGNALLSSPVSLPVEKLPAVKLGDLGLAREVDNKMTQCTGTWRYMAPEVLMSDEYANAADIFSCGILMHEVMSGKVPFSEFGVAPVVAAISSGIRPDPNDIAGPGPITAALSAVLEACWAEDPAQRPSAEYLGQCLRPLARGC